MNTSHAQEVVRQLKAYHSRRWFLKNCAIGLGGIFLNSMLEGKTALDPVPANPMAPKPPPLAAKAKRVIYLFQAGAPSHLDMFDSKPGMSKWNGKAVPASLTKGTDFSFIKSDAALYASTFKFAKHGRSGTELSELLPCLAKVVDDISVIRSMHTDQVNHTPAQIIMMTGSQLDGRPSLGAWTTYGLGSISQELPGFVVMVSGEDSLAGGSSCYGSGFLPTSYSGVPFRAKGAPILALSNPSGISIGMQRRAIQAINELNALELAECGDPEIATRIANYEMAYRMQASAPELVDLSKETKSTLIRYGIKEGEPSYATNCLLARRMIERGVRFVQLFHTGWDHHSDIEKNIRRLSLQTDQGNAALLQDLKERGLLEDTLVIWGGEFGRTPMVQFDPNLPEKGFGRDHHKDAFSVWMAGGGVKPGITLGETDEFGYGVVKDPVHVHDLNATILKLLGFDHKKFTFRSQGRDFRLTDVHGEVVSQLVA